MGSVLANFESTADCRSSNLDSMDISSIEN
jgi:hypothetical protein